MLPYLIPPHKLMDQLSYMQSRHDSEIRGNDRTPTFSCMTWEADIQHISAGSFPVGGERRDEQFAVALWRGLPGMGYNDQL